MNVFGRLSFWVSVFVTKKRLLEALRAHEICTDEQFEAFMMGFSQASPRFLIVDVGGGKDATDVKIKEYLQTFSRFPQTLRVFFGGAHDNSYAPTLKVLDNEQLLGKFVVLQGHTEMTPELQNLALPSIEVEGLFLDKKLSVPSKVPKPTPLVTTPYSTATNTNGGLMSPRSPVRAVGKSIDPSVPLHKQNPPPCNEHYLMVCNKNASCKYSHDYVLTQEQLASLRSNAKKAPCNWLKNGLHCPYGEQCCWGHVCPNGPRCFHLSKSKCWFKGEAMHGTV